MWIAHGEKTLFELTEVYSIYLFASISSHECEEQSSECFNCCCANCTTDLTFRHAVLVLAAQ